MYVHEDGFRVYGSTKAIHRVMELFGRLRVLESGQVPQRCDRCSERLAYMCEECVDDSNQEWYARGRADEHSPEIEIDK